MPTLARFFGPLTQDQKEEVLRDVSVEASQRYQWGREAVLDSVGLRALRGTDRLTAYQNRAPEIWANLQAQLPTEYQKQMEDWGKLEQRSTFRRIQPKPDFSSIPLPAEGL